MGWGGGWGCVFVGWLVVGGCGVGCRGVVGGCGGVVFVLLGCWCIDYFLFVGWVGIVGVCGRSVVSV